MAKIGRNDPCPCGKVKPDGSMVKYKHCCLLEEKIPVKLKITRKTFITSPYTDCPKCKRNTFGVFLSIGNSDSFSKECTECGHVQGFKLPQIKKKVIYIDQFVFDNIVKSLDKNHPKNALALKEPFWIEVFKKLEVATRSQLVVCPDSFFHREESGATNYFSSMQRIYEHFSAGVTFNNHDQITRRQIYEHFVNYLNGKPEIRPQTLPEKIVREDLHQWRGKMHLSINAQPIQEELEGNKKSKENSYKSFMQVFERWKTEKGKKFDDWYKEENGGFAKGTILALQKYYEKQMSLPQRMLNGENYDIWEMFPPPSVDLINDMKLAARRHGITDEVEIFNHIKNYLFSDNLDHIPIIRIGSLLYASLADQASKGRLKPPSEGVVVDVNMISSLMPYCDAIFVDKENASMLEDSRVKKKLDCKTKVFSLRNKEEFLAYLDEIIASASQEHVEHLKNYYGSKWGEPYLRILEDK